MDPQCARKVRPGEERQEGIMRRDRKYSPTFYSRRSQPGKIMAEGVRCALRRAQEKNLATENKPDLISSRRNHGRARIMYQQ